MTKLYDLKDADNGERLLIFHCPGCNQAHPFRVRKADDDPRPNVAIWSFNEDFEKPTFEPSLLVHSDMPDRRCHLFLRDGKIQYLGDCFHSLANQTVDMMEFDW